MGTQRDKDFLTKFSQTVYFNLPYSRYDHELFSSQPAACIVKKGEKAEMRKTGIESSGREKWLQQEKKDCSRTRLNEKFGSLGRFKCSVTCRKHSVIETRECLV